MSTYQCTLWTGSHKRDEPTTLNIAVPLYEGNGYTHSLADALDCFIATAPELNLKPIFTVGSLFVGRHVKGSWQDSNAIILECHREDREKLQDGLTHAGYFHIGLNTLGINEQRPRWAAIIPLDTRLDEVFVRLKVISLLAKDMQVFTMTKGYASITFQIEAEPDAQTTVHDGELVDVDYHLHRTGPDGFAAAANYEEE